MRPDTSDYSHIFLNCKALMDTRAPVEFARGSFPGAINLPLMTDSERQAVGTCYKTRGQQAAISLGHELVHGETKARRIEAWLEFARSHPDGYLFCFRGGLRSQIAQDWMREAGVDYPRISGGYKAMRRFLLDNLEHTLGNTPALVLGGQTGCGKTELLLSLPAYIDLEGLANHRGSAFGRRVGGQPAQTGFENALSVAMLRQTRNHPTRALLLEDESKLIGRMFLPLALQDVMKSAPLVLLESSVDERIEHTYRNYILDNLKDWQAQAGDNEGFRLFAEELRQSLHKLRRRLGGERYSALAKLMERALASHEAGNEELHRAWIGQLLTGYYDPMYAWQLEQKSQRIIFRGNEAAVHDFISAYRPGLPKH